MPTPPIILVDQDNVIASQLVRFHEILKQDYPEIYETYSGEAASFQFEKDFAPEHAETIFEIRRKVGFFRSLPMIAGAKEALEELEHGGCIVRIVTAPIRTSHSASEKLDWIAEHLGGDWCPKTIIARDKTLIRGDILIDDNPEVSGAIVPTWTHVLYDQPYNSSIDKKRLTWEGDFFTVIKEALDERSK